MAQVSYGLGIPKLYDANGNMTRDDYKAASVSYNSFNLPAEMDFGNNQKLSYYYDGSGA